MSVYLDHASTTRIREEVIQEMMPYLKDSFENPSSLYENGIHNKKAINGSRKRMAALLHCQPHEIYFCSGGSEANNWAIKGVAFKSVQRKEIITTNVEHHATLHACEFLSRLGYTIHYLQVDHEGFIDLNQLKELVSEKTLLVSIIYANNEIGTIQDIQTICDICHAKGAYVHTDAVQATAHIPLNLETLKVDLLSISAHKFNGPKGVGCLFIRKGIEIDPLIHGGKQENGLRGGTENTPFIVGMAKAMELSLTNTDLETEKERALSRHLINCLQEYQLDVRLNGPAIGDKRLPGNINVSFKAVDGSLLSYLLGTKGIFVSTGSACNSGSIESSHVLRAIQVPEEYINGTIRITLGSETTLQEIDLLCQEINHLIKNNEV